MPVAVDRSGVLAGKFVIAAAAGINSSLALCSDGTLAAWGWNAGGELGNNTQVDSYVPVLVTTSGLPAGQRFVAVAGGPSAVHALALVASQPAATVFEDSGAFTRANFATNISPGSPDELVQVVSFTVTNNNNALFAVQPTLTTNGTLAFTPALHASGTALVTIVMHDNGGTANGGVDTSAPQTFLVTVTARTGIPQPLLQSVQLRSGNATVVWTAIPGQSYLLQQNGNLGMLQWTNVGSTITATASTATNVDDTIGSAPRRFYRVQLVP